MIRFVSRRHGSCFGTQRTGRACASSATTRPSNGWRRAAGSLAVRQTADQSIRATTGTGDRHPSVHQKKHHPEGRGGEKLRPDFLLDRSPPSLRKVGKNEGRGVSTGKGYVWPETETRVALENQRCSNFCREIGGGKISVTCWPKPLRRRSPLELRRCQTSYRQRRLLNGSSWFPH